MPSLLGNSPSNTTNVNVYPTLNLDLTGLDLDTLTCNKLYTPRYSTTLDLCVEVPNLMLGVTTLNNRVGTLETKTTALSYVGTTTSSSFASNVAVTGSLSALRPSSTKAAETLWGATYNNVSSTYSAAGTGITSTISWRAIQTNVNGQDFSIQSSNLTNIGSSPTWSTASMVLTSTGGSFPNVSVSNLLTTNNINCTGVATIPNLSISGITTTGSLNVLGLATVSGLGISTSTVAIPRPAAGTLPQLLFGAQFDGTNYTTAVSSGSIWSWRWAQTGFGSAGNQVELSASSASQTNGTTINWIQQFVANLTNGFTINLPFNCNGNFTQSSSTFTYPRLIGCRVGGAMGSTAVSANTSVFVTSSLTWQNLPSALASTSGWQASHSPAGPGGAYVAPFNGYYKYTVTVRFTDSSGSSRGIRMLKYSAPNYSNATGNFTSDGVGFWVPQDPGNRRTGIVSDIILLFAGESLWPTTGITNSTVEWAIMDVLLVSLT